MVRQQLVGRPLRYLLAPERLLLLYLRVRASLRKQELRWFVVVLMTWLDWTSQTDRQPDREGWLSSVARKRLWPGDLLLGDYRRKAQLFGI